MKVITAALLFLLTIPSLAHAQAKITGHSLEMPFGGIIGFCSDAEGTTRPLPEAFALTGIYSHKIQYIDNGNSIIGTNHSSTRGTAVGLVSKNEYNWSDRHNSHSRFTWEAEEEQLESVSSVINVNIQGLYRVQMTTHLVFGKDLEPTLSIDRFRARCPTTIDSPR
jgi:hypothetical protein